MVKYISVGNHSVGYCDSKGNGSNNNPKARAAYMECVRPNKQFWGPGGSLIKNISLTDCKEKCKTTPGCNWFNWNNSECKDCMHENSCFLFSSKGTQLREGKGRFS